MTTNGIGKNLHYHNAIKSTSNSAVYQPSTSINTDPLTDKYTIGENIGRGKFAVVKKCVHKVTEEVLAAKFIKKRRRGKSCREEILREVVMLEMALDHPRLVNLKEVYETQQELILITEYCSGGELFTECILEEKFNESDVRLLMSQILEGLVYLHDRNIVHLDLKPQNILLTEEFPKGSVKICDLGFACLVNTGEDIRDIIGTPDYVAPEVLNYDSLGLYTDMWSLGVLTYVMLTTCSPFAAEDKQLTFCNITTVNLDFPDELFANISHAAQDFIKKLLIADPDQRMTAKDCLSHEWLYDIFQSKIPSLCLSENPVEVTANDDSTPEFPPNFDDEISELPDTETGSVYVKDNDTSSISNNNSEDIMKANSREKIEEQHSAMSFDDGVAEEHNDEMVETEIVAGEVADEQQVTNTDIRDHIEYKENEDNVKITRLHKKDEEIVAVETNIVEILDERESRNTESGENKIDERTKSESENIDLGVTKGGNLNVGGDLNDHVDETGSKLPVNPDTDVMVAESISPDTDSSMCISESKSHDSGIATGTDSKSIESVYMGPGQRSAEHDFLGNEEDSIFDDEPEDTEMFNKSGQCKEITEASKVTADDGETQKDDVNILVNDAQGKNAYFSDNTKATEGRNEEEMEHSDTVFDSAVNVSDKSTNFMKTSMIENSNILGGGSGGKVHCDHVTNTLSKNSEESVHIQSVNSRDQNIDQYAHNDVLMQSFGDFQKIVASNRTKPNQGGGTVTRSSVSNIDDSINNMQLGESLKRGMCNETSASENSENNDDEAYEFVSVSKRVRSIEDGMTPPTKSPVFSPKIARSPRIARHTRSHHHPHH